MTFKEQMQEKATAYISKNAGTLSQQLVIQDTWDKCSQAALSSDLVKGLVDALEKSQALLQFCGEHGGIIDDITTILTNYKQEVNKLQ